MPAQAPQFEPLENPQLATEAEMLQAIVDEIGSQIKRKYEFSTAQICEQLHQYLGEEMSPTTINRHLIRMEKSGRLVSRLVILGGNQNKVWAWKDNIIRPPASEDEILDAD